MAGPACQWGPWSVTEALIPSLLNPQVSSLQNCHFYPVINTMGKTLRQCKYPIPLRLSTNGLSIHDRCWPAAATAKSLQSCLILCDPTDGSPSGSPVPGILQARTLEWVAISFSNAWKWKVKAKSLSRARLLATPWTAAHQAPPSMGFSRQEYWSGVPLSSPWVRLHHLKT